MATVAYTSCESWEGLCPCSVEQVADASRSGAPCGTVWVHSWNLRSKIDMIFSLRQLQEKCRKLRKPLYIAFIDLTKAFD